MDNRLGKSDWLRAARLALLHQGPDGVRVEPLARALGVTKGSFYWHFDDREDLLEALLVEWEEETALLTDALRAADLRGALTEIMRELHHRNLASERGETPSDAAVFAWAATDPAVAKRANKAEHERMVLFRKLTGSPDMADLFFYAYLGFLLRRRRVPTAAGDFATIARLGLELLTSSPTPKPKRAVRKGTGRGSRARRAVTLGAIALLSLIQGCTTYRIVRWRDPAPDVQLSIFDQRAVHRADQPFRFAIAPKPRTDLDTVGVRDTDGRVHPFAEYLTARRIRAFLVIRNDTILYERYLGGYTDSTRSSSFSVAKSFTSALLGLALESGAIKSLDDPVTTYLPDLATKPDYRGVTIRHLLGMQSGFAYTRTNGHAWHDFRSSDAHFYYTTDLHRSLSNQHREDLPGTRWAYKDSDTELLGWILARATGRSITQQLEENVWRRVGTERDATWDLDHRDGSEHVASGLSATARDFARFARLYLAGGTWNGTQLLPRDWVMASTTLDRARAEPEVATWWQMQHQQYWWLPMHNWDAERDFYADGSKGQRIYVHPPTHTIIVELADESAQDFPFRKIAHYLAGEPYRYPRGIAGLVYQALRAGASADSARALFRSLLVQQRTNPADYVVMEAGLLSLGQQFMTKRQDYEKAQTMFELSIERSPSSPKGYLALADVYDKMGDKANAAEQRRRAAMPAEARQAPPASKASSLPRRSRPHAYGVYGLPLNMRQVLAAGTRSQYTNRCSRTTISPRSYGIGHVNSGPPATKVWNSPFSPHGSAPPGSSARKPSSNKRPAKLSGICCESTHTTMASKPSDTNREASVRVS